MYTILQAVQAMYTFMAARGGTGVHVRSMLVHFANELTAGAFAFIVLFGPVGFADSLGFVGIFPSILGILIIVLTQQLRV